MGKNLGFAWNLEKDGRLLGTFPKLHGTALARVPSRLTKLIQARGQTPETMASE